MRKATITLKEHAATTSGSFCTQDWTGLRASLVGLPINPFAFELLNANPEYRSIQVYIPRLLKPISAFSTPTFSTKTKTGLKYTLDKQNLFEKQRLHIQPKHTGNEPRLKGHKLTIRVQDIKDFDRQLIDGICTYLQTQHVNEEDI